MEPETLNFAPLMRRCLALAAHGAGSVAPNPMVGAVIVANSDGRILGEGFHRRYGEAHAEVNAVNAVKDERLLKDATLFVSLEPCSHYGKTPPCAELIIRKGIPRVVVACEDPFPEVAGRGIRMLQEAGIEVITGVLEEEAKFLNRYFFTAHTLHRPYVILKWAQSADGFIDVARHGEERSNLPLLQNLNKVQNLVKVEPPFTLSSPLTKMEVHKLRSRVQAIMVGTDTALLDNPSLTVKRWAGRSPVRALIDNKLRFLNAAASCKSQPPLLDASAPTLIFSASHEAANVKISKENISIIHLPEAALSLAAILKNLYERGLHSLLVEGGARLHQSFLQSDLWDEIVVETTSHVLVEGVRAPDISALQNVKMYEYETVPFFAEEGLKPSKIQKYYK